MRDLGSALHFKGIIRIVAQEKRNCQVRFVLHKARIKRRYIIMLDFYDKEKHNQGIENQSGSLTFHSHWATAVLIRIRNKDCGHYGSGPFIADDLTFHFQAMNLKSRVTKAISSRQNGTVDRVYERKFFRNV